LSGIVLQSGANLRDAEVQAALEIHECFIAPNSVPQVVPRHDLIGTLDETRKHLSGLRLETEEHAFTAQLKVSDVKFEQTKSKSSGSHIPHKLVSHDFRTQRVRRTMKQFGSRKS
jgi:hypothetical protein